MKCQKGERGQFVRGGGSLGGRSTSREYRVWWDMIQRCTNPKNRRYFRYGGRGITVDPSWMKFEQFFLDMGERPSPDHSIERMDNDSGYSASNCKWATRREQVRNRCNNIFVEVNGERMIAKDVVRKFNLSVNAIYYRMSHGKMTAQQAFESAIRWKNVRS